MAGAGFPRERIVGPLSRLLALQLVGERRLEAQPLLREAQNRKMADQLADISREIQALRALVAKAKAPKTITVPA